MKVCPCYSCALLTSRQADRQAACVCYYMLVLLSGLCTEMAETPVQEQQVVSFNQLIHERVWASQVEAPQRIEEIIPPPLNF